MVTMNMQFNVYRHKPINIEYFLSLSFGQDGLKFNHFSKKALQYILPPILTADINGDESVKPEKKLTILIMIPFLYN